MPPLERTTFRLRPSMMFGAVLAVAFLVSLCIDAPSRGWALPHARYVEDESWLFPLLKALGGWPVAAVAAVALSVLHTWRWRAGAILLLATAASQLFASILKWIVGRERPEVVGRGTFELTPFRGGLGGLFEQKNLSFPSGHATAAFSLAAVLCIFVPRGWPAWVALAALCGFERVASQAHWPSDVAGAAIVGFLTARLTLWIAFRATGRATPAASIDARPPAA